MSKNENRRRPPIVTFEQIMSAIGKKKTVTTDDLFDALAAEAEADYAERCTEPVPVFNVSIAGLWAAHVNGDDKARHYLGARCKALGLATISIDGTTHVARDSAHLPARPAKGSGPKAPTVDVAPIVDAMIQAVKVDPAAEPALRARLGKVAASFAPSRLSAPTK